MKNVSTDGVGGQHALVKKTRMVVLSNKVTRSIDGGVKSSMSRADAFGALGVPPASAVEEFQFSFPRHGYRSSSISKAHPPSCLILSVCQLFLYDTECMTSLFSSYKINVCPPSVKLSDDSVYMLLQMGTKLSAYFAAVTMAYPALSR